MKTRKSKPAPAEDNAGDTAVVDAAAAPSQIEPHPFPVLKICSPLQRESVTLTVNVRGYANVDDASLLTLLVRSSNGKLYPQGTVSLEGDIWNADAQFGNPNDPGREYGLILVYGAVLSLKSYPEIPDGLDQSNEITVKRTF